MGNITAPRTSDYFNRDNKTYWKNYILTNKIEFIDCYRFDSNYQYENIVHEYTSGYDTKGNLIDLFKYDYAGLIGSAYFRKYDDKGNLVEEIYREKDYKHWCVRKSSNGQFTNSSGQFINLSNEPIANPHMMNIFANPHDDYEAKIDYIYTNQNFTIKKNTSYKYDNTGKLIQVTNLDNEWNYSNEQKNYFYAENKLIRMETYDKDNNILSTTNYFYDKDKLIKVETYGTDTRYFYENDKLIREETYDKKNKLIDSTHYQYDSTGKLIERIEREYGWHGGISRLIYKYHKNGVIQEEIHIRKNKRFFFMIKEFHIINKFNINGYLIEEIYRKIKVKKIYKYENGLLSKIFHEGGGFGVIGVKEFLYSEYGILEEEYSFSIREKDRYRSPVTIRKYVITRQKNS